MKIVDLFIGLSLAASGYYLLWRFKRSQTGFPSWIPKAAVMLMVTGFMVAMWDLLFSLAGN